MTYSKMHHSFPTPSIFVPGIITLAVLAMMLAGCGGDDTDNAPAITQTPAPDAGGTVPPFPATLSPTLIRLQQDYESLRTAHRALLDIWEGLSNGDQVQCGNNPELRAPDSIRAGDDGEFGTLADLLRQAAIELEDSLTLWRIECSYQRSVPPPDVIRDGLQTTRTASDLLEDAADQLDTIQ